MNKREYETEAFVINHRVNMFKLKLKQKKIEIIKLFIILALLAGFSGCRALSNFLNPDKNSSKKQLKVVKRDKPNLSDDTEEREVDPDSDALVEATDEEIAEEEANKPAVPTILNNSNTAEPNADLARIEQKAKALVGRWEAVNIQEQILFEFTASKKEGDTYIGTFSIYVNGNRDSPSKYIVSNDEMIKLVQGGRESKIKCEVSTDGKSMRFINEEGEVSDLRRTTAQPNKQAKEPEQQQPPKQQQPPEQREEPRATPYKPIQRRRE